MKIFISILIFITLFYVNIKAEDYKHICVPFSVEPFKSYPSIYEHYLDDKEIAENILKWNYTGGIFINNCFLCGDANDKWNYFIKGYYNRQSINSIAVTNVNDITTFFLGSGVRDSYQPNIKEKYTKGGLYKITKEETSNLNNLSWVEISNFHDIIINSILAINNNLYVGTLGYGIRKSVDNGANWTQITGAPSNVYSIAIDNDNNIFVASGTSKVYKKIGNQNWESCITGLHNNFVSNVVLIGYLGSTKYIYTGGYYTDEYNDKFAAIYQSTNEGDNWSLINTPSENPNQQIQALIIDNNYLYAGYSNKITKKSLSGGNWNNEDDSNVFTFYKLTKNNNNYILAGTSNGIKYKQVDASTWNNSNCGQYGDAGYNSNIHAIAYIDDGGNGDNIICGSEIFKNWKTAIVVDDYIEDEQEIIKNYFFHKDDNNNKDANLIYKNPGREYDKYYNCHGYAWSVIDCGRLLSGGQDYADASCRDYNSIEINPNNEIPYKWCKITYHSSVESDPQHSAVLLSYNQDIDTASWVISKWSNGPIFIHMLNNLEDYHNFIKKFWKDTLLLRGNVSNNTLYKIGKMIVTFGNINISNDNVEFFVGSVPNPLERFPPSQDNPQSYYSRIELKEGFHVKETQVNKVFWAHIAPNCPQEPIFSPPQGLDDDSKDDNISFVESDFFIDIFPNPCSDKLNIKILTIAQNIGQNTLSIKDIFGREVIKFENINPPNQSINVDVSLLSSGTYYIIISNKYYTKAVKFVKL